MSQNQSKLPSVVELLEMSRTQIVAEAFLLDEDKNPKYLHPNKEENEYTFKGFDLNEKILQDGNNHTSILTAPQIKEFMENWKVVAYLPNTTTGFSGTLFQAKRDIPGTTIKAGEKVMSLRSTEFIDDETRDSQQINTFEIADRGWAFGQIDDLEQWFQGLRNEKLIGDSEQIRITGYSLGGHLATAFNILHRDEGLIKNTYTFNGAGVGKKTENEEMDKGTLRKIMDNFHENRKSMFNYDKSNSEIFKDYYIEISSVLKELPSVSDSKNIKAVKDSLENISARIGNHIQIGKHANPYIPHVALKDLKDAIKRISTVISENERVYNLSSGTGQRPAIVENNDIAALGLDYQLAIGQAAKYTYGYPKVFSDKNSDSGFYKIFSNERSQSSNSIEGFYDIYAKNPPSMVASSQLHYGHEIPISVENQPLGRGGKYTSSVIRNGFKLLVNNYGYNDFGDTHSIALLNDSLESMDVLNKLNQQDDINIWDSLIKLSSNKKTLMDEKLSDTPWWVDITRGLVSIGTPDHIEYHAKREANIKMREWDMDWVKNSPNSQGYADGDAIESLVNALAKTFGVDSDLKGDPNGNTWYLTAQHEGKDENGETHTFSGRTDLHNKLREVSKKIESYNLGDGVEFKPMDTTLANTLNTATVRENFGYLVSLHTLSPFSLVSKGNSTALDKVWTDNWNELYQQWKDDKAAYDKGQAATHFSDEWINDRIQLLTTKSFLNFYNIDYDSDSENFVRDVYLAAIDDSKGIEEFDKLSKAEKVHYAHEALKKRFPYLGNFELTSVDDNIHIALYKMLEDKESLGKIVFGSEKDTKPLIGSNKDDHLYGAGGKDILQGSKGNDHMEGGSGFDTYHIEGHDTVFDADSKGELRFGKDKAEYFIPETPNSQDSWTSSDSNGNADGKFRAVRDGQNLVVISVANEADKVTVKDYFNGRNTLDGALDLYDVAPKPEPEKAKEYTITPKYNHVHNEYNLGTDSYLVQGSLKNDLIWANSALPGKSGYGLVTQTGAGNDIVYGSLYPDIIEGGADTDVLLGSAPKTTLTGKQKTLDANLMSGNEGRDFIMGGFGNDIIHAGNIDEHLQLQERKEQGDWVNGAEGNDALYGSAAQDIVQGGAGTDTIRGGAGNDLLVGDSNAMVYAHIDRNYGTYLPVTHIHSYNLKENKWNRIEQVQISNRLIDKSAEWKLEIDHDKQDYFITRDYHDWENNASLVAEEEGAGDDIEGGTGDDMLIGQRGDDVLDGQGGNDIVFGDDNRDKSIVGNDHLRGGSGSDTLIGGKGADSYYFFREELQPEEGKPAPTDIVIDDGRGDGNKMDEIFLDGLSISSFEWNYDKKHKIWSDDENGWQITKKGSELNITHKDYPGVIRVLDYAYGDYELRLSERKNGPFPDPEPAEPVPPQPVPPQPVPPQPEPPKPEQPKPEQPQAPTAGKPLAAQSIHEKDKLTYTLAEDTFHTANQDDKLSYSARLADGKPLPKWLNFDAATRTFSGTPGNDDVGTLDIEISVQGKGGSASQHLALNVINVNDAPYISAPFSLHSTNSGGEIKCNSRTYIRDIDKGDKLTFSAEMRDGQPLPSWLSINAETGVLTGTLPFARETKDYYVRITATDKAGASTSGVLLIRGEFRRGRRNGTDNDDILKGGLPRMNMIIHGYGGNDTITGSNLHDDLYGDKGNDVLDGGSGNDIYHFARGDGNDIINNHDTGARRHDSIDFSDMNRSDFDIRREGNNLVLRSKDGNNQITVTNHFQPGWQIDGIRFADGMTLDHNAINSLTGAQNPPQGNYTDPATQALQMNQAIASLNSQAQPLDALATPDLQPRPLLAPGNP